MLYFPHGPILGEQYGLEVTTFHIGNDDACGETRNFLGDMLEMGVCLEDIRLEDPSVDLICFGHSETMRKAYTH